MDYFKLALALTSVAAIIGLVACSGTEKPTPTPAATVQPTSAPPTSTIGPADPYVIDLASTAPLSTIFGGDAGDMRSDLPPVVTGDFNADGIDDILVGARFGDGPNNQREGAGEAYVIFGSADVPQAIDIADAQQDLTIWGAAPGDSLGFAATAADINDDGIDDIIVAALFAAGSSGDAGSVYIVFGGPGLQGSLDLAEVDADVTIEGPEPGGFFGDSVAAGDINGDDLVDIIIGATFRSHQRDPQSVAVNGGATYVVFGSSKWPAAVDTSRGEFDVAIFGADDFDELGDTVASGDINGDGFDDIIMTAEAADGPDNARPTAAEVHVVFGSPDLSGDLNIGEGDQDLSILGADPHDTLGFSLATGDLDGDGVDDLVMSARGDNGPRNSANAVGAVYLLAGGPDLPSVIDLAELPDVVAGLYGIDSADLMSHPATGDLDGDGRQELLVGTSFGDGPNNDRLESGDVYILDAAALGGYKTIDAYPFIMSIFAGSPGQRLGTAIALGDVNDDGAQEIIVMAADADGPEGLRPGAGRVYVLSQGE